VASWLEVPQGGKESPIWRQRRGRCRSLRSATWLPGGVPLLTALAARGQPDHVASGKLRREAGAKGRQLLQEALDLGPTGRVLAWDRWNQFHLMMARGPNAYCCLVLVLEDTPDGQLDPHGGIRFRRALRAGQLREHSFDVALGNDGPAVLWAFVARNAHAVEVFYGRIVRKETAGKSGAIVVLEPQPSPAGK